jgi:hypothetical protein
MDKLSRISGRSAPRKASRRIPAILPGGHVRPSGSAKIAAQKSNEEGSKIGVVPNREMLITLWYFLWSADFLGQSWQKLANVRSPWTSALACPVSPPRMDRGPSAARKTGQGCHYLSGRPWAGSKSAIIYMELVRVAWEMAWQMFLLSPSDRAASSRLRRGRGVPRRRGRVLSQRFQVPSPCGAQ